MITEYKVLEPFGSLDKDDILKFNDEGMFECTKTFESEDKNYSSISNVTISRNIAEEYAKSGLIEAVSGVKSENNKLKEINTLISQLKNTYNQRKNNVEKKYKKGKIQTCVKVEHDTVYFNLMKLLNKIESIVNE